MPGYGEHSAPVSGQPSGTGAERKAEEPARRAWAKPVVRRFSLQKTLAGSGIHFDMDATHSSAAST
jgi:hypothetical protein